MTGVWISRCATCGHSDMAHGIVVDESLGSCEARINGMPCMCLCYIIGNTEYVVP